MYSIDIFVVLYHPNLSQIWVPFLRKTGRLFRLHSLDHTEISFDRRQLPPIVTSSSSARPRGRTQRSPRRVAGQRRRRKGTTGQIQPNGSQKDSLPTYLCVPDSSAAAHRSPTPSFPPTDPSQKPAAAAPELRSPSAASSLDYRRSRPPRARMLGVLIA